MLGGGITMVDSGTTSQAWAFLHPYLYRQSCQLSKGPKAARGWAPPVKEWDKEQKARKGGKKWYELKEEWNVDSNLVQTTIKKAITPDWKWKTEKTVEVIPDAKAESETEKQKREYCMRSLLLLS
jgi:hypothetical protein